MTVVWFNMLFSDHRTEWDPNLLTDSRVTHYWDPHQRIGLWFNDNEMEIGFEFDKGPIVWDSYFLFGPEATWDSFPAPLASYGNTVLAAKEELLGVTKSILGS